MTGFFLHYSDDGQRWASYSESGDKQHSNVCHMFIRKSLLFVIFFFKKEKQCLFLSYLSPTVILASAAKFLRLSARTYGELVSTCDYVEVHLSALSIAM